MKERRFKRVILETTLKVFHSADEEHIRQVCAHMFRLWRPLTDQVDTVSVLLWVGEGTEILVYKGDLDEPFEYGRYCGFANWQYPHAYEGPNSRESRKAEVVLKDPPVFTYGLLRTVVSSFREMGAEITGKPVTVGATFDPGPEFAESPWKYALHNEVFPQITGEERRKKAVFFLNAFARLEADSEVYAGFPDGISKGTSFGVFFGRQCHHFLTDLGYDYVWFSNGFGFSHYGTSTFGDAFDGATYRPELTHPFAEKTLSFWRDFRRECPTFPVETRGTNYSAGLDLASDGVPLREIYGGDFDMAPPVNSPWGALDADFGLELTGYMTRMAEIPGADYPFRFYSLDPWFQFSPWFDVYDRAPFDIYLPLAAARIDAAGKVRNPSSISFLSVDHTRGYYPERLPVEITLHILTAADHFPDAPGLLTWIYPFDEYHEMAFAQGRSDEVFFGDAFARASINHGLPLNSVVSTGNFVSSYAAVPELYADTVLFTPVPDAGSPLVEPFLDFVASGGRILFFGPVPCADERIVHLLNLKSIEPLSGEFELMREFELDRIENGSYPDRILHRQLSCAGGIGETLADATDADTTVGAVYLQGEQRRVAALVRRQAAWNGGIVGWVRGTVSAATDHPTSSRLVQDDAGEFFQGSLLVRLLLTEFGIYLGVDKRVSQDRAPLTFVSRSNNGFFFSGHAPDSTVRNRFKLPWGAPVMTGMETRLEEGCTTYFSGKSFHRECRVFVEQQEPSTLSCLERGSRYLEVKRRLQISGLKDATLRFFPEADCMDRKVTITRFIRQYDPAPEPIPFTFDEEGKYLEVRAYTGALEIAW